MFSLSILDDNKILFSQIIQDHLASKSERKDSEIQEDDLKREDDLIQPSSKKQSLDNTYQVDIDKEEVLA